MKKINMVALFCTNNRKSVAYSLIVSVFIIYSSASVRAGEIELFNSIREYPAKLSPAQIKNCKYFLKKFPQSANVQDVKLILAKSEKSPTAALKLYDSILLNNARTDVFDDAVIAACQLSCLLSRYDSCERYARMAVRKHSSSSKSAASYLVRSDIMLQNYDEASSNLNRYSDFFTSVDKTFYLNTIKVHTGFEDALTGKNISDASLLYIFGRNFEYQNNRQYAYSAYKDLVKKYPRSPEALLCIGKVHSFEKCSVKYSSEYLKSAKNKPVDSMSPDREISDDQSDLVYSVLVGPFTSEKEARILKKEMTEDFDGVVIVKNGKGYLVFIGNEPSAEMAVSLKVRLAEEFGLNGKIVQRRNDNGREYIYGD